MTQVAIFWPMIAQVALIYAIYGLVSQRRIKAVKAGKAKASQFRENLNEPEESLFARNSLVNQFELPVLFFVVCILLHAIAAAGLVATVLAWIFVLSRIVHAWIHVTSNRIRYRRPAFVAGFVTLGVMWAYLAYRLAFA